MMPGGAHTQVASRRRRWWAPRERICAPHRDAVASRRMRDVRALLPAAPLHARSPPRACSRLTRLCSRRAFLTTSLGEVSLILRRRAASGTAVCCILAERHAWAGLTACGGCSRHQVALDIHGMYE